jgi:hypothetical protein
METHEKRQPGKHQAVQFVAGRGEVGGRARGRVAQGRHSVILASCGDEARVIAKRVPQSRTIRRKSGLTVARLVVVRAHIQNPDEIEHVLPCGIAPYRLSDIDKSQFRVQCDHEVVNFDGGFFLSSNQ